MNKYYCVLLEGYYETEPTLASGNLCSHIPDILKKEYSEVDIETLRDDFLLQDNRIVERENSWLVFGSFPIILEEKDGKLYDVITNTPFKKYDRKNPLSNNLLNTIYYREIYPATSLTVRELLASLDEESISRYKSSINAIKHNYQVKLHDLEKPRYYHLELTDTKPMDKYKHPVYAEQIGGCMVDIVTNTPIYCSESHGIKSHITYETATPVSKFATLTFLDTITCHPAILSGHIKFIEEEKHKAATNYNNYISVTLPTLSSKSQGTVKEKKLIIKGRLDR